ncbi:MAG: UbiX family flavin prenyltransferase [Burkholderiaceae bacterium]|nr:UbiX family flavin prenyltransferase [Burkholderiaceae bacterium]MCD8515745.1 UbiX family flavin prenyltransferase [Burkholderiaceae bacterium]MCD8536503.1 UbiX family flavin prenyltransferase [Burkholderiaceae bacterium]MCD8564909.1 UbiX family flavin prenyltransferase [Burkholderiaceae bacterium]
MSATRRLVVGITGATGSAYAIRLLEMARAAQDVETHLVVSASGVLNVQHELGLSRQQVHELADQVYNIKDVGATLASGSFATTGMVVVPCSMRTLAAIAIGLADNLITRAADVTLKERRRLVLAVRETPFNLAHLRNMTAVTEMGAIVFPPLPAFYHLPKTIDEIVDHSAARMLELAGIEVPRASWQGLRSELN